MAKKLIYSDSTGTEIELSSSGGAGGGSEPSQYIKDASVSEGVLTLTKKDGTQVDYSADLSAYRTASAQDTIDAAKLPKAIPTAEQGTKEYLYSFAGETQNTDIAVINDMTGGSENYTDKMVPTAKSVATAFQTHLADYRTSSNQDSLDAVLAQKLAELEGKIDSLQRVISEGNFGEITVSAINIEQSINLGGNTLKSDGSSVKINSSTIQTA